MDKILQSLQGKAFNLSDSIFSFLSGRYEELVAMTIPDLNCTQIHSGTIREIIYVHREQFLSEEYVQSRITNSSSGTIDHLHAEITAATSVNLGRSSDYTGYALELVRTAGHLHDSDRSFPETMIRGEATTRHDRDAYRIHKEKHALSSTQRTEELLNKVKNDGYYSSHAFLNDLQYLILRHELGGKKTNGVNVFKHSEIEPELNLNDLTDIVTNSDSLAYFDANILTNWQECSKDKIALSNKVHFMYDRMTKAGKEILNKSILESNTHILGTNSPDEEDIQDIRNILLEICK